MMGRGLQSCPSLLLYLSLSPVPTGQRLIALTAAVVTGKILADICVGRAMHDYNNIVELVATRDEAQRLGIPDKESTMREWLSACVGDKGSRVTS